MTHKNRKQRRTFRLSLRKSFWIWVDLSVLYWLCMILAEMQFLLDLDQPLIKEPFVARLFSEVEGFLFVGGSVAVVLAIIGALQYLWGVLVRWDSTTDKEQPGFPQNSGKDDVN